MYSFIPENYKSALSVYDTQKAISLLKRIFIDRLAGEDRTTPSTITVRLLRIRRELGELMDARNFLIAEYDDSTKTLFAQPSLSSDEKELLTRWSGEKSLTGMVIRNRHAMRFSKEEIRWLADEGAIDLVGARAEAWIGVARSRRSTRYMLFPSRAVICFV